MTPPDPSPKRPGDRRGLWLVLAPLSLGLVYFAAAGPLLRGNPSLRDMVPEEAIEVQRYRNLAVYDATHPAPETPGRIAPKASAILGAELNLPGLAGVDPSRPLLVATLPPAGRGNPDVHVLPVADAKTLKETFARPDLAERHAKHLAVHGSKSPWAALGWDQDAVRRAGRGGGLWAEERGEDWSRVADWPQVVDFALLHAQEAPFRSILAALGYDESRATRDADGRLVVPSGRVPIVRDSWKTVALYGFPDRIRAELVPSETTELAQALRAAKAAPAANPRAAARFPLEVEAALSCFGPHGRRAVALALWHAGVAFPADLKPDWFAMSSPGSLLLVATLSPGALPLWTLGLVAPPGAIPDLAPFGLPTPPAGSSAPLAAGAGGLLAPYGGDAPAGTVARAGHERLGVDVVAIGADGATAAPKFAALLEAAGPEERPNEAGVVLLARFRLAAVPAARLLGGALGPGGILAPLSGGAIEGALWTDGVRLVLEASRAR
jgi:hypothetical protein